MKMCIRDSFATIPSEEWKNGVGSALTAYAAGTGDWDAVKTAFEMCIRDRGRTPSGRKLIFEENGSRKKFVPRFTDVL